MKRLLITALNLAEKGIAEKVTELPKSMLGKSPSDKC